MTYHYFKHYVIWLLCNFALCQTCTIFPVLGSQFLEGVESRLRRSGTAQMMALSSLSQVSDCCLHDAHLLLCMVVVAFLLLFDSALKGCESVWPILLPPANSLYSILWPTQADSLHCQACLTCQHTGLFSVFLLQTTTLKSPPHPHPSTNLGCRCLTLVI